MNIIPEVKALVKANIKFDLTEPTNLLIEKFSNAVGVVYQPVEVVFMAGAKNIEEKLNPDRELNAVKRSLEIAEYQDKLISLSERTKNRALKIEAKKQANFDSIVTQAIPHLNANARPQDIDNDWAGNFHEKSRIVSDDVFQELWSRILAGEANAPGRFSKKTINILNDIDKRGAELFRCLCCFCLLVDDRQVPFIFQPQRGDIYAKNGIDLESVMYLDALGLIRYDRMGVITYDYKEHRTVSYFDTQFSLTFPDEGVVFHTGSISFTYAGEQLMSVCKVDEIDGFVEYLKARWVETRISFS